MEYTNEVLKEMEEKQDKSKLYGSYYYFWSQDMTLPLSLSERLKKKSDRINDCCNLWDWNVYHKNKIMDLQRLNRCMNNRFCPNCKKFDIAKTIKHFSPIFENLVEQSYKPYLVTLTVPNCTGEKLEETINHMNKAFRKFNHLYSMSLADKKSFKDRSFSIDGILKVLEVTYNNETREYHPHFHCLAFTKDEIIEDDLIKNIDTGLTSRKKNNTRVLKSLLDIEISTIWTMCYKNIRITQKNYNSIGTKFGKDIFMCDIREMDQYGIYEVLKYTFKDSDISNLQVFKTLNIALERKRLRQGYGILYNVKLEDIEDGEVQELELLEKETPQPLLVREIRELYIKYGTYRKISRFNNYKDILEKVQEFNN